MTHHPHRGHRARVAAMFVSLAVAVGTTGSVTATPVAAAEPVPVPCVGCYQPTVGTTFQIQLTGIVKRTVVADLYDIDLFDNTASVVADLHARGRKVACYFSAGSFEDWRPDAASFPAAVKGQSNGWPGERWLDIRRLDVLGPIIEARLDQCSAKGFDTADPDNVDGYANSTGFPLTAADQLAYNRFIADAAHARGLSVGLKNDLDQIPDLLPWFDWAINEQCAQYQECDLLLPFVFTGKPVMELEYTLNRTRFCPAATANGFFAQKKRLKLGAWRAICP